MVTSDPAEIFCPASTCIKKFAVNTKVTLTATSDSTDYQFTVWDGACQDETSTMCTLTIYKSMQVTASFQKIPQKTLTVYLKPVKGQVTVTDDGGSVTCTSFSCQYIYQLRENVVLVPTPNDGYTFDHWGRSCSGRGACSLTMSTDKIVEAYFIIKK